MINKISCFLFGVALLLCFAMLYSCTSDIESPEEALKIIGEEEEAKAKESSSSDGGETWPSSSSFGSQSSSSSENGSDESSSSLSNHVSCEIKNSEGVFIICIDMSRDDCNENMSGGRSGEIVESCETDQSSSSSDEGEEESSSSSDGEEGDSSSSDEDGDSSSSSDGDDSSSSAEATSKCGEIEYDPETQKCESGYVIDIGVNHCEGNIPANNLCDKRDNKKYPYVTIGQQIWMAKNLDFDYDDKVGRCPEDDPSLCTTYGRLYDWATAMGFPSDCNSSDCASQIKTKHQGICPDGWHLPSTAEWTTLQNTASPDPGKKLKATDGWDHNGNGEDTYKFKALPGGFAWSMDSGFNNVGQFGNWWAATQDNDNKNTRGIGRYMSPYDNNVSTHNDEKVSMQAVRCVRN